MFDGIQEIGNLTRLKNLKDLRFADPQWGDSPLALLHNYQVSNVWKPTPIISQLPIASCCPHVAESMLNFLVKHINGTAADVWQLNTLIISGHLLRSEDVRLYIILVSRRCCSFWWRHKPTNEFYGQSILNGILYCKVLWIKIKILHRELTKDVVPEGLKRMGRACRPIFCSASANCSLWTQWTLRMRPNKLQKLCTLASVCTTTCV